MTFATMQQRRDTAANWTSVNPVLAAGEMGLETDTHKAKMGDGATAWTSLAYWSPSGTSGGGNQLAWVNAVTAGADPTGGTDSWLAIQTALLSFGTIGGYSAGNGGVVYLPVGDYALSKTLVVPAGVWLMGDGWGAVLDLNIGANCDVVQFATYNSSYQATLLGIPANTIGNAFFAGIEKLQIHGDSFHTTVAGYNHGISITLNPLNSTAPGDPEFDPLPTVRDVMVKAVTGDGVHHAGRSGALLERVYVEAVNGIAFVPSYDTTMVDCLAAFNGAGIYLNHGSNVGTGCKSYNAVDCTWVSGASYAPNSFGRSTAVATYTTGGVTTLYFCIAAVTSATPPPSDPTHWTALSSATAPQANGHGMYFDTNVGEHTWSAVDCQENSKSDYYFHGPLSGAVSVHGSSTQPNFNNGHAAFNSSNPNNYASVVFDGCSGVMALINTCGLGTSNNNAVLCTELNSPGSNTLIATTDGSAGAGTTYLFSGGTPKFALVDGIIRSTGNTMVNGTLATAHNTLDDGSGNVTVAGTLATAHNTLDDGSGNVTLHGTVTADGKLIANSGAFSSVPFISSEDGTDTSHGALVHVIGGNGTEFGHYLLWYDATDPAYIGLSMALGSGHTYKGQPIIALGGYYNGLGIQGSTNGANQPVFGVLTSTQSGNGIGHTALTIYDTNKVVTFSNTLDDGSGNATIAGVVRAIGVQATGANAYFHLTNTNDSATAHGFFVVSYDGLQFGYSATSGDDFTNRMYVGKAFAAGNTLIGTTHSGTVSSPSDLVNILDDGAGNATIAGTFTTNGYTTVKGTLDLFGNNILSANIISAAAFAPAGLTGATAASRYVGATAAGHPTTGTFAVGDFSVDRTGSFWICTAAGTPGTWASIAVTPIDATASDIQPLGTQAAGATGKAADAAHVHPRLTIYKQAASSVTPSATISTFGSAVTINPDSGFTGYLPTAMTIVSSGLATETITVQTVTTYTDNSTNTQSAITTITTNTTTGVSLSVIAGMLVGSDTRLVKSVAFSVKSSIGSSTASLTFNLIGINLP